MYTPIICVVAATSVGHVSPGWRAGVVLSVPVCNEGATTMGRCLQGYSMRILGILEIVI